MKIYYVCPICGYNMLEEPPYDESGYGSFDICPCCFFEFGSYNETNDSEELFSKIRKEWIINGKKWNSQTIKPPRNWDPDIQLDKLLCKKRN